MKVPSEHISTDVPVHQQLISPTARNTSKILKLAANTSMTRCLASSCCQIFFSWSGRLLGAFPPLSYSSVSDFISMLNDLLIIDMCSITRNIFPRGQIWWRTVLSFHWSFAHRGDSHHWQSRVYKRLPDACKLFCTIQCCVRKRQPCECHYKPRCNNHSQSQTGIEVNQSIKSESPLANLSMHE